MSRQEEHSLKMSNMQVQQQIEDKAKAAKADPDAIPCEFCGDMQYEETIMRHQRHCSMNPRRSAIEVTQSNQYDATSLRRSQARRNYSLSRTNSFRERSAAPEDRVRRSSLSRQSSFSERSYTFGRSDVTPASTYNSTFSRLGRPGYDYAAATRRSNLFDGYTGFAIYSSISQGLDEITYGGRRSRRNSITEPSFGTGTGFSAGSRRGSVSGGGADYAAILAANAAVEAVNRAQDERISASRNSHNKDESGLGTSPRLSRNDSTRLSNSCQSDSACESSPAGTSKRAHQTLAAAFYAAQSKQVVSAAAATSSPQPYQQQQQPPPSFALENRRPSSILSRQDSLTHSNSNTKLERKVSFHTASEDGRPISKLERVDSQTRTASAMSSVSNGGGGGDERKSKKKKDKDKTGEKDKDKEARREEKRKRKEQKKAEKAAKEREMMLGLKGGGESCGDLLNQVSEKLKLLEMEQNKEDDLPQIAPSSLLSAAAMSDNQQLEQSSPLLAASITAAAEPPPHIQMSPKAEQRLKPTTAAADNDIAVKATVSLANGSVSVLAEPEPPAAIAVAQEVVCHQPQPEVHVAPPPPMQPASAIAPTTSVATDADVIVAEIQEAKVEEEEDEEVVIRQKRPATAEATATTTTTTENGEGGGGSQKSQDKSGSKRNSLDSKTVQGLAQDLAAECAKAYALMESSLTKFSSDFGPFGMTPRGRKSKKSKEKASQ